MSQTNHEAEIDDLPETGGDYFPRKRLDEMRKFAQDFQRVALVADRGHTDALDPYMSGLPRWARRDAGSEGIFLARELDMIRKGLYEVKYGPMKSKRLVSYNTSLPEGIDNFTVKTIDTAGEPMIERDDSDQVPKVSLKVGESVMGFFNMTLGYDFTEQEVARAMYAGLPLQTTKAEMCRRAFERKLDIIAFYGEKTSGVKGLLNQSGTTTYTTTTTGASNSPKFSDKQSDDVLLDLNASGDAIITATDENEEPDTWLLPLDAWVNINTRRVGDGTSMTILQYFKANRKLEDGGDVTVERTVKSQSANIHAATTWADFGTSNQSRMMVYKNDSSHVEMMVPNPFRQRAPEYRNARTIVNCYMRTGGVALWLPKSVAYADGVS